METPFVSAIIVQDAEGARISAKYYSKASFPDALHQVEFEKKLFKKTKNSTAKVDSEVLLLDGMNVVYRSGVDVTFIVVGSAEENELILAAVLDALCASVASLLKAPLEKRNIMMQLELLLLSIDELVDGGVPLELDPAMIESRVLLRGAVPESISSYNEATITGLMGAARDRMVKQFVK